MSTSNTLLVGDIGGTKTLLGLFDATPGRPTPIAVESFGTLDYDDLPAMVDAFLRKQASSDAPIAAASFGVAGPVIDGTARLTNVPWTVDAREAGERFGIPRVSLLNDLEATAWAVPALHETEVYVLQPGHAAPTGNVALIAAGTGLGEALLHNVNGRLIPSPSEGGHADFAARNEREITILRELSHRFGRVAVERVVSGPGLVNIARITHPADCPVVDDFDSPEAPSAISRAGLERRCPGCVDALTLFVEAYGAETGNLALRTVSTGGVFVGGGIAPKILPALTDERFIRAFRDKAPLEALLAALPVKVILNPEAGLLGAAVFAAGA